MKIKIVPKSKLKIGKGKSNQGLGGNPAAAKKQKWVRQEYKQTGVSSKNTIIVANDKHRSTIIKHEKIENALIKYKHRPYSKAHNLAEHYETLSKKDINKKIRRITLKKCPKCKRYISICKCKMN